MLTCLLQHLLAIASLARSRDSSAAAVDPMLLHMRVGAVSFPKAAAVVCLLTVQQLATCSIIHPAVTDTLDLNEE